MVSTDAANNAANNAASNASRPLSRPVTAIVQPAIRSTAPVSTAIRQAREAILRGRSSPSNFLSGDSMLETDTILDPPGRPEHVPVQAAGGPCTAQQEGCSQASCEVMFSVVVHRARRLLLGSPLGALHCPVSPPRRCGGLGFCPKDAIAAARTRVIPAPVCLENETLYNMYFYLPARKSVRVGIVCIYDEGSALSALCLAKLGAAQLPVETP